MTTYDLAVAYKWIYDREFTELVEQMFQANGLKTFIIGAHNVFEIIDRLNNGELYFKAILDRGSDEDENFQGIADHIQKTNTFVINGYKEIEKAIDKASMHNKLLRKKLPVVESFIIPPLDRRPALDITQCDMDKLGIPFIIKPSYYSGGGEGVITDATTIQQIEESRKINSDDSYLIQKRVYPDNHYGRRIWLRVFWFFNDAIPLWWNDQTHLYDEISKEDFEQLNLQRTIDYSKQIAQVARLEYFSTEYTIDRNNQLFIIDYVNDQCDMRMKSKHYDGVPDWLVKRFIEKMIEKVKLL